MQREKGFKGKESGWKAIAEPMYIISVSSIASSLISSPESFSKMDFSDKKCLSPFSSINA